MSAKHNDHYYSPGDLAEFSVSSRPVYRDEWLGYLAGTEGEHLIAEGTIVRIIRQIDPTAEGRTFIYSSVFTEGFYLVDVSPLNLTIDGKALPELIVFAPALRKIPPLKQLALA